MITRRNLLAALATFPVAARASRPAPARSRDTHPVVVSTWKHGLAANAAAFGVLTGGGYALDAVEQGIRVPEADPEVSSVGYGGLPDREGIVTLDACIIDERGHCGAVAAIEEIMHPISVARRVMERTPHLLLVGAGARAFALAEGFPRENLLTEKSRAAWEQWRSTAQPPARTHDTIGMLALDAQARLCGGCSTSGLAWKLHDRVGDSPIVGAGLFCDPEVGGACSTGVGEATMKICGTHTVVERMRAGRAPQDACRDAVELIARRFPEHRGDQIAFLAMTHEGEAGAFAMRQGFQYAVRHGADASLIDAPFLIA